MSWIHIDDLIGLIAFLMKESTVRGVFNATSPFPVTNREFTRGLAEAVHRPAILPVPAWALRLMFGEMSQVLLASQRALPDAAQRAGFIFQHPDIFAALAQLTRAA
jgi:NAD dependent epimerase/dehydratase family enzyme